VEPGAKRRGGPGGARAVFFMVLIMARMIGYVVTYGAFGTAPPTLPYRQVRSWGWRAKQAPR